MRIKDIKKSIVGIVVLSMLLMSMLPVAHAEDNGLSNQSSATPPQIEEQHNNEPTIEKEIEPTKDSEETDGLKEAEQKEEEVDVNKEAEPQTDSEKDSNSQKLEKEADKKAVENVQQKGLLVESAEPTRAAGGVPSGTVETRDPWYPTVTSEANGWQIVDGDYRDGQHGATTEVTNTSKSVVIRKNILPTKDENIFTVALKVRTQTSWSDLLDATSMRIQNGNSDHSSKVHYFEILPQGPNSIPVEVYFMNAPNTISENSLPGNYPVVYKKTYYLDPSNTGNWFLYFNNPLIGMGDHGGQKQKVEPGVSYYIPIGTTMQNYEVLHHAAVATKVTDVMGPGVRYVQGSARNNTQIPGVSGKTSVSVNGDTLTWNIDDDGTIPVGQDYKVVRDTLNGKTVYYREYDLTYDVHLDASDPEFVPGQVYPTNTRAHLDYTYDPRPTQDQSDFWNDFEQSQSPLIFPVPSVKGTLYNLTFRKTDSKTGEALDGAEFTLTGNYGAASTPGASAAKTNYELTAISCSEGEDSGIVTFENLPWGTYDLQETKAPRGWNITFAGLNQKLCVTTTPNALEKQGEEYWLKPSFIGDNGVISNEPWPEGRLTLKKNVTNFEDIISQRDKDSDFNLQIMNYDPSKMVFFDGNGNIIDEEEEIITTLKHQDSSEYTVRFKEGSGTFNVSEVFSGDSDLFLYRDTVMSKNEGNSDANGPASISAVSGTESAVTIREGNDITLTVNNEYRFGEVSIKKKDSVTGEGLDGAQFDVFSSEQEDAEADAETVEMSGITYYKLNKTQISAEDGSLTFSKLPASSTRSYVIKETLSPKGYLKMDELIPFVFDADCNVILGAVSSDDVSFDSSTGTVLVDNHKIYELPDAGGIGTHFFAFIGALIIATAALSIMRNRKVA